MQHLEGSHPALYVWSKNRLLAQLLAAEIEEISGHSVHIITHVTLPLKEFLEDASEHLLFCDCWQEDVTQVVKRLNGLAKDVQGTVRFALVNVEKASSLAQVISKVQIDGIFRSKDPLTTIRKGIRGLLDGELWLSRDLMQQTLQSARRGNNESLSTEPLLTSREKEILQNIAAGYSNQEIAKRLYISINTVKTHVSNIYAKINAPNRIQAILWATKYLDTL